MRYLSSISLALIVHVLLSIGILMALACTATPATLAPTLAPTTAAATAPVLTEGLVTGLVEKYRSQGWSHSQLGQNRTKENCQYASFKPIPTDGLCTDPNWQDLYPGWDCIYFETDMDLTHQSSHWELMVSGSHCDGVEIFRIEDSYDGTVKRVRP